MFKATGHEGQIKRGAVEAASLGSWSLVPGSAPGSWLFTARVKTVDAFHITQAPDVLQLTLGNTRWRWRGVNFEIGDGNVMATLDSAPEER
jgi:hypothetical protein